MENRKKGKFSWQVWCVKKDRLLFVCICLLFLCLCSIFFCRYQRNLARQRMQWVGEIYLQNKEAARIVLNQMMAEQAGGIGGRKAQAAGAEALEVFGYTGRDFALSGWEKDVLFAGELAVLVFLFLGGSMFLAYCRSRAATEENRQLCGWLQEGAKAMRAVLETDVAAWNGPGNGEGVSGPAVSCRDKGAALIDYETVLRKESVKFAAKESCLLGDGLADWIAQYRILWENQTKLRQNMKSFTENIAHQMKTPLTRMTLALDMMETENMEEKREICLQELEQVRPLVEGILNISRMESGRVALMSRPVDMWLLLQDAVYKTGHREDYCWKFQGNSQEELIVYGDEVWLAQAFFNLYENAARYTPPGGVIETEVSAEAEGIQLEIRDEGGGIPEQAMQTMFERFYSADSQDLTRTGIGLNLARAVVEQHHGRMQMYNEEGGAVFSVYLPVYQLKGEMDCLCR